MAGGKPEALPASDFGDRAKACVYRAWGGSRWGRARAHLGSLVWVPMGTGTVAGGVEEEDEGVRRVRRHLGLPGVGVWLDGAPSLITIH